MNRQQLRPIQAIATGVKRLLRRSLQVYGPATFVAFGCLLFLAANVYFLLYNGPGAFLTPIGLLNLGFYGVLDGSIVHCGVLLGRSDVSPDRSPRAVARIGWGIAFLLFLNGPVMALLASVMSPQFLLGWVINVVGTGSVAGAVVGVVEARSIERAHVNQRLVTEREAAESHARQFD